MDLGVIDFSSVTIDSAPIIAFANLAKANREVKLDDSMARALFEDETYLFLAKQLIGCFLFYIPWWIIFIGSITGFIELRMELRKNRLIL